MRILIVGNHTCGNRGDAAIMRGLLDETVRRQPCAHIDVTSRYPISSSYLLGRPVDMDLFQRQKIVPRGWKKKKRRELMPWFLRLNSGRNGERYRLLLTDPVRECIETIRSYDLVIQVGGSNFVDLYGLGHFEAAFATLIAEVPLVLVGHSIGPITKRGYAPYIRHLLERATYVGLRESASRDLLERAGMPMCNVDDGVDTAWSVSPPEQPNRLRGTSLFGDLTRPLVAITARSLAPFHKRLQTTQSAYEKAFGRLVNHLIDSGYDVIALATCTGIESYHADDRMIALSIGRCVLQPAHFHVVMDELDDVQIGQILQRCEFLVGTRLHSAIIAMNFGTPAIAIGYEHKSSGTLVDMQLPELSADMSALLDGALITQVDALLARLSELRARLQPKVAEVRERSRRMVDSALCMAGF